ncbi:unnamed protein product [Effrenium voratum]|nr:unnamed protein product [Effrenium voratum]
MSHEFWMGCFVASSTAMLLLQKVASQTEMRRFSLLLVQAAFLAPALGLSAKAGIFQVKPLERRMLFIFLLPSALFLLLLISEPNVTVPALLAARSLGLCLVASGEYLFFHQGKTLCQKWGMALVLCGAGCGLRDLPLEFSLWLGLNSLIHVGFQLLEKPAICATAQTPEGLAIIQNFYVLAMGSLLFLAAERPGRPVIKAPLPWELVLVLSAAAGLVLNLSYVKVNLCFQVTSIAMAEVLSLVFVSLLGSLCFWREDTMSPGHFAGAMLSLLGASIYAEPLDFLRRRRSRFRCLDLAGLCLVLAVLHGAAQQTLRCSQSVSHMSEETLSRCLRISVLVQEHRRRGLAQDRDNSTQFVPDACPSLLPQFSFSTPLDDGLSSCGIAVVSALFGGYDEFDFRSPSFEACIVRRQCGQKSKPSGFPDCRV